MLKIRFYIGFVFVLNSCMNTNQDNGFIVGENESICPKNHTDSIIPIIYGMPSEEMFIQADSGLVRLMGCEVSDNDENWYCKKHNISF